MPDKEEQMAFNQDDAFNLNRAAALFGSIGLDTDEDDEMLTWFPIKRHDYGEDAANVLAEALMSATRFDQSMNTWIEIQCDTIPVFVERAIDGCAGFGLRLVVTHKDASSHRPGELLATGLQGIIARASDRRPLWHPVAKKIVESIHYQRPGRAEAEAA
ncbi:hypothetical protein ACHMW6_00255 (plasmid) [Pseudoduganella sp. UC29_106]|uniref:hypothetical protein n=1 Tax=Pseudoduganella sp. UC29_106 TaxID=3374553 RepID=UPI0037582B69